MNLKVSSAIFLVIASFFICYKALADSLRVAFGVNRPPFVFKENGEYKGIEIDIVKAALKLSNNFITEPVFIPNKRLESAVQSNNFDAAVGVRRRKDSTYYSDDFVTYKNYAISKKKDNITLEKISNLTKFRVAAWQNAHRDLGAEYTTYFGPKNNHKTGYYKEFANQKNQNKFFWYGRSQIIIIDKTIFRALRKTIPSQYDTNQELVYHDLFPQETYFQVNFKSQKLRNDFNRGLAQLKLSGEYEKIINKYL